MHKIFTILSCLENIKSGEVKTTNFYYNLLKSGVYEVGDISNWLYIKIQEIHPMKCNNHTLYKYHVIFNLIIRLFMQGVATDGNLFLPVLHILDCII